MKIASASASVRRQSGILLAECLVYIAVFFILFGIATATFYVCWNHTHAIVYAADQVESAVRAGEHWRTDIRAATGPISVETADNGETIHIPENGREILYRFHDHQVERQATSSPTPEVILHLVKSSDMKADIRGGVAGWRWEVEVSPRRKETHFPLLFTFEAVPNKS